MLNQLIINMKECLVLLSIIFFQFPATEILYLCAVETFGAYSSIW